MWIRTSGEVEQLEQHQIDDFKLSPESCERIMFIRTRIVKTRLFANAMTDIYTTECLSTYFFETIVKEIRDLEFALQKEWGFFPDPKKHKHWNKLKECQCLNTMSGYRYSVGCVYHCPY